MIKVNPTNSFLFPRPTSIFYTGSTRRILDLLAVLDSGIEPVASTAIRNTLDDVCNRIEFDDIYGRGPILMLKQSSNHISTSRDIR